MAIATSKIKFIGARTKISAKLIFADFPNKKFNNLFIAFLAMQNIIAVQTERSFEVLKYRNLDLWLLL